MSVLPKQDLLQPSGSLLRERVGRFRRIIVAGNQGIRIGDNTIAADGGLMLTRHNPANAASVQALRLRTVGRITPADNDEFHISFEHLNSVLTQTEFARLTSVTTDVTDATEDAEIQVDVMAAGTLTKKLTIANAELTFILTDGNVRLGDVTGAAASDTGVLLNGGGSFESAFFTEVNGTLVSLGINMSQIGSTQNTVGSLFRFDTRGGQQVFTIIGQNNGADEKTMMKVPMHTDVASDAFIRTTHSQIDVKAGLSTFGIVDFRPPNANVSSSFRVMPRGSSGQTEKSLLEFFGTDGVADTTNFSQLRILHTASEIHIRTNFGGTGTASPIIFDTAEDNASVVEAMRMDTSARIIINEGGADLDFRVEGDTDPNLLFCNAGEESVTLAGLVIKGNSPDGADIKLWVEAHT